MKKTLANLSLSLLSIILILLILEFLVFRFMLIASDLPSPEFTNGIVKYRANQEGVYRVKDEIKAHFRINSDGWNSKYEAYATARSASQYRIAIIGDSYVSAFQVDYEKSVAEQLELSGKNFQVYRFGIDGAPLSQYLHMFRREILRYNPSLVIIILVHNDFYESYGFKPGVYTSAFLKLKIEDNMVVEELEPTPYETPWYNWIRESATWRYLAIRQKVRFQILRDAILGKADDTNRKYLANINVSQIDTRQTSNEVAVDYIFRKLKQICDENSAELLIVMDGDRNSIYQKLDSSQLSKTGALRLNQIANSMAEKYQIAFLDLHQIFEKDYSINKKKFNFKNDGHWNAYAHKLVAEAIRTYMWNDIKKSQHESN